MESSASLQRKESEVTKLQAEYRERSQELNVRVVCHMIWAVVMALYLISALVFPCVCAQEKITSLAREVEIRRVETRELKDENTEKAQKISMLTEQLTKVKSDCASRLSTDVDGLQQQLQTVKFQLHQSEAKLAEVMAPIANCTLTVLSLAHTCCFNGICKVQRDSRAQIDAYRLERERVESKLQSELETARNRLASLRHDRDGTDKAWQDAEARLTQLTHRVSCLQPKTKCFAW